MPIYTSGVKKQTIEAHALTSGGAINTAHFTEIENGNYLTVHTLNDNVTVDGNTVNPFRSINFFTFNADSSGTIYASLLINKPLQPGEEVIISGYFFKGNNPVGDNNQETQDPFVIVYQNDPAKFTEFKTAPSGAAEVNKIIGQGVVPLSNGENIGTLNNGWKYNTTGRSSAANTQVRNQADDADQTDAALYPFNMSDEGSFSSRFYTVTIRNDSAAEAFLKLTIYDPNGAQSLSDSGSVYDLRVEFKDAISSSAIEVESIAGAGDSPLTIRSDKGINLKLDHDNDNDASSTKVSFISSTNVEVASVNEGGDFDINDLTVQGSIVAPVTIQSANNNSNAPNLILRSLDTDTDDGPGVHFKKNGIPVDGTNLGEIYFYGDSRGDANSWVIGGYIFAEASDTWNNDSPDNDGIINKVPGRLRFGIGDNNSTSHRDVLIAQSENKEIQVPGMLSVSRGMSRNASVYISEALPSNQSHKNHSGNKFVRILRTLAGTEQAQEASGLFHVRVSGNAENEVGTTGFGLILEVSFRGNPGGSFYYSTGTRLHILSTYGDASYFNPAEDIFLTWENRGGGYAEVWMKGMVDLTHVQVADLGSSGNYVQTSKGFSPVFQDKSISWVGNTWRDEETALAGSINPTASTTVNGVGTSFTTELKVEDHIRVNNEVRTVTSIASDTQLTVSFAFTDTANDTSPQKVCYAGISSDGNTKRQVFGQYRSAGSLWHLGDYGGHASSFASLTHNTFNQPGDSGVSKNYALLQKSDGGTYLNASTGKYIYFRTNNSTTGADEGRFKDGTLTLGTKVSAPKVRGGIPQVYHCSTDINTGNAVWLPFSGQNYYDATVAGSAWSAYHIIAPVDGLFRKIMFKAENHVDDGISDAGFYKLALYEITQAVGGNYPAPPNGAFSTSTVGGLKGIAQRNVVIGSNQFHTFDFTNGDFTATDGVPLTAGKVYAIRAQDDGTTTAPNQCMISVIIEWEID